MDPKSIVASKKMIQLESKIFRREFGMKKKIKIRETTLLM